MFAFAHSSLMLVAVVVGLAAGWTVLRARMALRKSDIGREPPSTPAQPVIIMPSAALPPEVFSQGITFSPEPRAAESEGSQKPIVTAKPARKKIAPHPQRTAAVLASLKPRAASTPLAPTTNLPSALKLAPALSLPPEPAQPARRRLHPTAKRHGV
jgi:hypothetical protein